MSTYYDPDAILTDAQKVPCTFQLDVPGLGYIDGNAGSNIKVNDTLDLPLWLGTMLAVSSGAATSSTSSANQQNLVTLDFPTPLAQRVLDALRADPKSVDLRQQAPHFYALAAKVLDLFEDDEVVDVLVETFKARANLIADHAHNIRGSSTSSTSTATNNSSSTLTDTTTTNPNTAATATATATSLSADEFLRGLDETERRLFRAAHDAAKDVRGWSGGLRR